MNEELNEDSKMLLGMNNSEFGRKELRKMLNIQENEIRDIDNEYETFIEKLKEIQEETNHSLLDLKEKMNSEKNKRNKLIDLI